MITSKVKYTSSLRTECLHMGSGSVIHTDAPKDNKGKGEKFSPTDLLATAYASCMLTIIGLHCEDNELSFVHGEAVVTKVMASAPRRIAELKIELDLRGNGWDEKTAERIIRVAEACPVAKSVHPDIKIEIKYHV